jgi:hypothetical protein
VCAPRLQGRRGLERQPARTGAAASCWTMLHAPPYSQGPREAGRRSGRAHGGGQGAIESHTANFAGGALPARVIPSVCV